MSEQAVPINRQTGERFVRVVKSFLSSEVRWRALGLFAVLIGLLFAISGLNVVNSYVGRDFMTAISGRDRAGFVRMAILYLGVFAASTVVAVFQSFAEQRLGLLWRAWLTGRLITFYLAGRTYYWLKETGAVDNPDQRIAEDVKAFTATTLSFTLIFLNGTFTVVAFAGVLWTISRLLFGVAVGYAALGSLLTILLGRPLVGLNYRQLDREANFRSALNHVHEHAESVALLHWEGRLTCPAAPPPRRSRGQLPANHVGQPQPGVLHDRLQLPDPDHPGPDRGPAVHPRGGRVRGGDPVGDGLRPAPGGVLADHQPVPIDLLVRRRHRPGGRARGGRRAHEGTRRHRPSRPPKTATAWRTSG